MFSGDSEDHICKESWQTAVHWAVVISKPLDGIAVYIPQHFLNFILEGVHVFNSTIYTAQDNTHTQIGEHSPNSRKRNLNLEDKDFWLPI